MVRLFVMFFVAVLVMGCSQEPAPSDPVQGPAAANSGEAKASTDSQLSLNPDYKPK